MSSFDHDVLDHLGLVNSALVHPCLLHPSGPDQFSILLPVGKHSWMEPQKVWEMRRRGKTLAEIEAARDDTHHHITIKLRRSRSSG